MYYAATKFLLTNEYLVLDNVPALTIPLKYGQTLRATPRVDKTINLTAHDHNNKVRYTYASDIDKIQATDLASMCFDRLQQNGYISHGRDLQTHIDFDPQRGLGTSSTFISLVAQRAQIEPFTLYNQVCSGSGYDLACAQATTPLLYTRTPRTITPVTLSDSITQHLYFVYSNQKQSSHNQVVSYRQTYPQGVSDSIKKEFTDMTHELIDNQDIATRQRILTHHDSGLATILDRDRLVAELPRTKELGIVKPLGARGGDFFMIVSERQSQDAKQICSANGYKTCLTRSDIAFEKAQK